VRIDARLLPTLRCAFLAPWRLSRSALLERLDETLVGSLAMTVVTIGCVGAAMCDQAAAQALRLLGDMSFIGPEYLVLGVEEYAPLIVAFTFAARVGAGFAAEVATLKSEQTLDALALLGAEPERRLLAPMGIAAVLGGLLLTLFSVGVWEVAGALTLFARQGVNPLSFYRPEALAISSVVLLVVKGLGFGAAVFLTALVAGLSAGRGADEVGTATTRAVVWGTVSALSLNMVIDIAWWLLRGPT